MIKSLKGRKLYKSEKDSIIGGVCGGIAEYLEIDSTVVRIIFVILLLFGPGALLYVIAWFIIPERPAEGPEDITKKKNK